MVSLTQILTLTSTPQFKYKFDTVEMFSVRDYCHTKVKSRPDQIKMAVVLDLMEKDLKG